MHKTDKERRRPQKKESGLDTKEYFYGKCKTYATASLTDMDKVAELAKQVEVTKKIEIG